MLPMNSRKTKIVSTLGPASESEEVIQQLIEAGVNVFRMNFSHGTHEEHKKKYDIVRSLSAKLGKHTAVFVDLCGPKIRIGAVADGEIHLTESSEVRLYHMDDTSKKAEGNASKLYIGAFNPVEVMEVGHKALLADGRIMLQTIKLESDCVVCKVLAGGTLRSKSGISVPESKLDLPCVTEKDKVDLAWAIENKVDYVALSFVGSASDVEGAKSLMNDAGHQIPIISKIERARSLDNISAIVEASEAVMVARGDLGLELPLERVPAAQRLIISEANLSGTPVITATQMLMSMVNEIRPTRAEVSDIYTAVRDGTDAVMLSDETAIGKHPAEVVKVLATVLLEAEKEAELNREITSKRRQAKDKVADAVCYAATNASSKIEAGAIIACTESGSTAALMAKYRPSAPILGATSVPSVLSRMALLWGVHPLLIQLDDDQSMEEEVSNSLLAARDTYGLKPGARVVITVGLRTRRTGSTSVMEIRDVPRGA